MFKKFTYCALPSVKQPAPPQPIRTFRSNSYSHIDQMYYQQRMFKYVSLWNIYLKKKRKRNWIPVYRWDKETGQLTQICWQYNLSDNPRKRCANMAEPLAFWNVPCILNRIEMSSLSVLQLKSLPCFLDITHCTLFCVP